MDIYFLRLSSLGIGVIIGSRYALQTCLPVGWSGTKLLHKNRHHVFHSYRAARGWKDITKQLLIYSSYGALETSLFIDIPTIAGLKSLFLYLVNAAGLQPENPRLATLREPKPPNNIL